MSAAPQWGDLHDDSDDETTSEVKSFKIPPTQKSRIDSKGIQIITSYRQNPSNPNQLLKTTTKVKVHTEKVKESKHVQERRGWAKFGQAKIDEKEGTKATVQSKDEILLEDPNADTDLQEEDTTATLGNLNAFWAKQHIRQLQRKYDVDDTSGPTPQDASKKTAANAWTQVTNSNSGSGPSKYVPPSLRGGGGAGSSAGAYKPPERKDDLNTIRVTNLSESTTEADLQELFSPFGRISRVYLAKDKETMISRGFAFVSFVSKDDAARAMAGLQGYGYDHLILKLEWARPNTPKDPSAATEYRSGYGKALAQDTKKQVSYASNLTK